MCVHVGHGLIYTGEAGRERSVVALATRRQGVRRSQRSRGGPGSGNTEAQLLHLPLVSWSVRLCPLCSDAAEDPSLVLPVRSLYRRAKRVECTDRAPRQECGVPAEHRKKQRWGRHRVPGAGGARVELAPANQVGASTGRSLWSRIKWLPKWRRWGASVW